MTEQTSQLARARATVVDLNMKINAISRERSAKTTEANSLIPKLKEGDTRANKKVLALNAEIDQLQSEENKLNSYLMRDRDLLLRAEAQARHARAVLRTAEDAAASIAEIVEHLRPAQAALEPIRLYIARNAGGLDMRMRPTGLYSEQDRQAFDRVVGILSRCTQALAELEQARAYAAEIGLPEDADEPALVLV